MNKRGQILIIVVIVVVIIIIIAIAALALLGFSRVSYSQMSPGPSVGPDTSTPDISGRPPSLIESIMSIFKRH